MAKMGNKIKSNKIDKSSLKHSVLHQKELIHPDCKQWEDPNCDKSLLTFELSKQPQITLSCKQVWLIRHGERVDEVPGKEQENWKNNTHRTRMFDPPLTTIGFKQATERAKLLLNELSKLESADYPKCIFSSPTERTLGTAMSIALILKLPIIVIPGLSECAAAVRTGGLLKIYIGSNGDLSELGLKRYGGACRFLERAEVKKRFCKNGVEIIFDYTHIDEYEKCVKRLVDESKTKVTLCVTHREGIRDLDKRLCYSRIPYCAMAKYAQVQDAKENCSRFVYFEDHTVKK